MLVYFDYKKRAKSPSNLQKQNQVISSNLSATQSPTNYPQYWGTVEGKIIKAIVKNGHPLNWKEIQQITGEEPQSLNKALSNLFADNAITKAENNLETNYRVSYELFKTYNNYLHIEILIDQKRELENWIIQWNSVRNLNLTLENQHFFLEGRHLDDFSKELISHAKSNVLVVNPFIRDCDLSNTLSDIRKKGIDVHIITRQPQDRYQDSLKKRIQYHNHLQTEGVELSYSDKVHAKIIVVDNLIAVVSSMNFYPESSAGVSWEAGLITVSSKTVESIIESIKNRII